MTGWHVMVADGTRLVWHGVAPSEAEAEALAAESQRLAPQLRVVITAPNGAVTQYPARVIPIPLPAKKPRRRH